MCRHKHAANRALKLAAHPHLTPFHSVLTVLCRPVKDTPASNQRLDGQLHAAGPTAAGKDSAESGGRRGASRAAAQFEYHAHPAFPELPEAAPLTYTLTMHACLSISPADRPTFVQVTPPSL